MNWLGGSVIGVKERRKEGRDLRSATRSTSAAGTENICEPRSTRVWVWIEGQENSEGNKSKHEPISKSNSSSGFDDREEALDV